MNPREEYQMETGFTPFTVNPGTISPTTDYVKWLEKKLEEASIAQADHLPDAGKGIEELKRFISDDAAAITYQSLGQYRSALLKMIKEQPEFQHSPKQCLCPFEGHTRECDKCDKRTTTP